MTYVQPLFTALLLAAAAILFFHWRSGKLRKPFLPFLGVGALFLVSWPPVAEVVTRAFEAQYPPRTRPGAQADGAEAIVVLSSDVFLPYPSLATPVLGEGTHERCEYAAWLHMRWRPLPVLACGGTGDRDLPPFSAVMRDALVREGVPESAVWVEERSHSTHENAVYAAALLRQKGIRKIVLVTEAYHMPRAAACFRREGLTVIPAACGYRSYHGFHWRDMLPGWQPIAWNEDAVHESIGLLWYWIRGWI
jgi:uncharacterized SAM-binding protein YcdF (DUF218 family)